MMIYVPESEGEIVLPSNKVIKPGWNEVRGREKNYEQVQNLLHRQFERS